MRNLVLIVITAAAVWFGILSFSHAQARSTPVPTPLPTAIPTGGTWLYMGHGQSFGGECALFSEPIVYTDGTQWQITCMPLTESD